MRISVRTICALVALVAVVALPGAPAAAQSPAPPSQTVRAAGMPLADGALPPGSLTVRLVQGSFAEDLAGIPVNIEIDGRDTRQQQSGAKGRAEFAHLPVGARVRAWAIVKGERLESDVFQMPAESGIRVLLMTGTGAAAADPHAALPVSSVAPAAAPTREAPSDPERGATVVRVTVASITVLAFVLVAAQQLRRRRH